MRRTIYGGVIAAMMLAGAGLAELVRGCHTVGGDLVVCGIPQPGSHLVYALGFGLVGVGIAGYLKAISEMRSDQLAARSYNANKVSGEVGRYVP